jgi:hypothetical protein
MGHKIIQRSSTTMAKFVATFFVFFVTFVAGFVPRQPLRTSTVSSIDTYLQAAPTMVIY